MLYGDGGPGSTGHAGHLRMEGREVFRHAVLRMAESVETALQQNGFKPNEIDWLVPHQANIRILDAMINRLPLPSVRIVVTFDSQAHTTPAPLPLRPPHHPHPGP